MATSSFDDEHQRAVQRVGQTPEARVRWLIVIGSRYRYIWHLTPAERRALRLEMGIFCARASAMMT